MKITLFLINIWKLNNYKQINFLRKSTKQSIHGPILYFTHMTHCPSNGFVTLLVNTTV